MGSRRADEEDIVSENVCVGVGSQGSVGVYGGGFAEIMCSSVTRRGGWKLVLLLCCCVVVGRKMTWGLGLCVSHGFER